MTTLLTEWLYIAAQMPHGTHAQQNVFRAAQRAGRFAQALGAPVRGAERLAAKLRDRGRGRPRGPSRCPARRTSTPSSAARPRARRASSR